MDKITRHTARLVAPGFWALAEYLGVDLATGMPVALCAKNLLNKRKRGILPTRLPENSSLQKIGNQNDTKPENLKACQCDSCL